MQRSLTKNISDYERIEVPYDKVNLFVYFIIIFTFLILYIGFVLPNFKAIITVFSWRFVVLILYFLGVFILYYTEISILRKFLCKEPGLIISKEGITNYSTVVGGGLIEWADIIGISEKGVFITIFVANPVLYISRQKNLLKRGLLQISYDEDDDYDGYTTPFLISTTSLGVNQTDLLALIKNRWEIYLANKNNS
jgi:hypothetical protein